MTRAVASVATGLLLFCGPLALEAAAADRTTALASLRVSFKLDPRLSGSTYGGERWLSPPVFTAAPQPGKVGTVEVRVRGVDAGGRPAEVVPEWTIGDPAMVDVAPAAKGEFRIAVKRAGATTLTVSSRGARKELSVSARYADDAIHIEISQRPGRADVAGPARERAASRAPRRDAPPADRKARQSYALGLELGERLGRHPVRLDPEHVSRGVRDALAGRTPLLSAAEAQAAVAELRLDARARSAEARGELANRNAREGETFLIENGKKEGVVTLPSGLQYEVVVAGDGPRPTLADTVVCHYRARTVDGAEFDSSHRGGKPATFALKRVVKGWREALELMPVGSRWRLAIPPRLAYGRRGAPPRIGPNATLLFEVELLGIKPGPRPAQHRDTARDAPAAPSVATHAAGEP
ncbi:MAG TPA: FKBP-type peptidyl-prolyl cis-trans isomerase [Anaeromyxobacter sp.]|nr:FKBP-type peptidyl-prolyl cis-trans isomerase [Anaeromyxobacter sp.]